MQTDDTFDTTNALSAMYLWLLFGFLSGLLNCDVRRLIYAHPLVTHMVGLVTFFFLFTLLDTRNRTHIKNIWMKTVFIYLLFVMMTKSKWYFVVPVLGLLLLDQSLKKDVAFRRARLAQAAETKEEEQAERTKEEAKVEDKEKSVARWSGVFNKAILVLVFAGTAHYAYLQHVEYKEEFSWFKFAFGVSDCKRYMPDYGRMMPRWR